jgi:sortase A
VIARCGRARALALLPILLIVAGVVEGARGAWIPAKAALAQQLLERAWLRTRQDGEPARAWPWADTWPVARLLFPESGVSQIVLAGASGESLAFGPGHTTGSVAPGHPGTSIVSGHRDTHFAHLRELMPGDRVVVERSDGVRIAYRVEERRIVDSETARLQAGFDDVLVLVTCWPFDTVVPGGSLRLVVTARRIS